MLTQGVTATLLRIVTSSPPRVCIIFRIIQRPVVNINIAGYPSNFILHFKIISENLSRENAQYCSINVLHGDLYVF